ncbi:MAG: histidine triad nucleotide-binding protein [Deltaproteobacteria bacterium]|nr:histidine triad nucleotide-binding protein [Deltaproteobacteria bacterium]
MTIFGKIIRGEIPCSKVYEDDLVLAFDDISPGAPCHVLIIPKQEGIQNLNDVNASHAALLGHMLVTARRVAELKGVAAGGYRTVLNTGNDAGQSVYYIHMHVLGGRDLAWPPG